MILTETSIIYKSDNLLEAEMKDSLALMSIEQGFYYGLNPVGKEIWKNMDKPIEVNHLINHLLDQFSVEKDTCKKETLEFLNELLDRKIVRIAN